jgi:hypothetical protein
MPLYTNKRTILVKSEVTYGTDPVPTGAANAVLCKNLEITPMETELASRDLIKPYYGANEQLVAGAYVRVSFDVEMAGSGTAGTAPAYDALLKACGMASTVTAATSVAYAPISTSLPSVTIYYNVSGVLHKVKGARGNLELVIETGQIPVYRFTFLGLYNAPTDTAAPTVDYTSFKSPNVANSDNTPTFSLFSYSGALQSLNINFNNSVVYRSLIGAEDIQLNDRNITGTAVIEAPTIATKDFFTLAIGTTVGSLSLIHGKTAGYKVELASSRVNVSNPSYTDNNGITMMSLPLQFVPSSSGNDELTITVK